MISQLLLTAFLAVTVKAQPSCDFSPEQIEKWAVSTISSLKSKGYKVVEGGFRVYNSTGFGANPGNPYVTYFHPGLVRGKEPIFKLSEKDAVLFLGCTPSSAAYYSWRSYAFFEDFKLLFASLGDSLNNLVINATASEKNKGRTAAVVTTADKGTYQEISGALARAGFSKSAHNLDAIPSSLIDMGRTQFLMLHRASVWGSESERQAYFAQNRKVYFITPPDDAVAAPFPVLPLRTPGNGKLEADVPEVKANLGMLKQNVIASMKQKGYKLTNESQVWDLHLDGFECLKEKSNCLGDNRDTHYLVYKDDNFVRSDVYVIMGANSVKTSKCTYTNIGIYKTGGIRRQTSTTLTLDDRQMLGSAKEFNVDTDFVFTYSLQAKCNGSKFCLEVGEQIPADQSWAFAYRTYLEPATGTGPKLSELVLPTVLKFSKSSEVIV